MSKETKMLYHIVLGWYISFSCFNLKVLM